MENDKVSQQKLAANKYMDKHDLDRILGEMLNSLVHENSSKPTVYMIKYLAGLLSEEERRENNLNIPGPYPKGKPIVRYPVFKEGSTCILKKNLSDEIWSRTKYDKTKFGGTIMNVIKITDDLYYNPGLILTDGDVAV